MYIISALHLYFQSLHGNQIRVLCANMRHIAVLALFFIFAFVLVSCHTTMIGNPRQYIRAENKVQKSLHINPEWGMAFSDDSVLTPDMIGIPWLLF